MKKGIITVLSTLAGSAAGAGVATHQWKKRLEKESDMSRKLGEFYHLLIQWMELKQEGKSLSEFFERNGYRTIAIYGMKELGERLCDELKDTGIEVAYAIDKNADQIYADVVIVTPDDNLEKVDAVVVTAIHYFDEIEELLSEKMDCPVLSLEDVVYEI